MRPVKVCCFCEKWESGGIESFLHNVLLHMDLRAIRVDIVAAELAESVFTGRLRERGIRFVQLSGKQQKLGENYRLFRNLLQAEHYDVVHLNIFHGLSLYYAYLAKQENVPVRVAHSHNTALRKSPTRVLKQFIHQIAKELFTTCATDLWACSEMAAEFLFSRKALESRGFQFIPNGIDTERFRFNADIREKVREELGVQDKYVVGNIGRLCYQKNQDFLLDVFHEVVKQRPESRLLLVGEGPDRPALEEKAERLEIADKVIFYGTSDRVEQLLWGMDVFAMPSRFEGLPVTAVEAQASGVPCLFSDAITEECRISSNSRFLPRSGMAAEWAGAVLAVSSCEDRTAGACAARASGFDVENVAQQIEQFYLKAENYGRA